MSLFAHQQQIVKLDPKRCGIFHGTGGGKTATTLTLAQGKVLVVCPKQQREERTWQNESKKHNIPRDLTVMSKEEFRRDWETLPRYDTIIFDECHEGILGATPSVRYVQRKPVPKTSQLFEAARLYIETKKPERVYLVTATPTRSPMAVWAAGVLVGKWDMDTFYQFRDIYYIPMPTDRRIYLPRRDAGTKRRLGETVRKIGFTGRLEDWFDVPDQIFKDDHVGLTKEQENMLLQVPLMFPDPIVTAQKEYQVENGFLIEDNTIHTFKENYTKRLLDYHEEFEQLYLVVMYTWQINYIADIFKKEGVPTFVLTGQTEERKDLMEQARKTKPAVVIAQAQITSGYELPSYPCTIFVSFSHRIVDYIQAQGRTQRANAIKKNIYIHLITGEQSEARLKSIKNKEDFHEHTYAKNKFGERIHDSVSKVGTKTRASSRSI